jgi:Winged helix DNA-binding domain
VKSKPDVDAELSWAQVHAFRLQRHHLARRSPRKDLARVVRDIMGAQAQVMSAAELQIAVRVDCTVEDVRTALWTDKTLVKTWLMRGTLHLAAAEDLPLYTAATSARWSQMRKSWLTYLQTTESEFWKIVDEVSAALDGTLRTREELIAVVGKGKSERFQKMLGSAWGGMLKPAARSGQLCFGPNRGQSVTFVRPADWLGWWREVEPERALPEVARRYLRAYGPASRTDFARWWGVGNSIAAWSGIEGDVVKVSVEGARLLMGHASRDHLVARVHLPKVSRSAGWISAVVLVDGAIAGTWTYALAGKTFRVTVEPFRRLPPAVVRQIKLRAGELAEALGAAKTLVSVA